MNIKITGLVFIVALLAACSKKNDSSPSSSTAKIKTHAQTISGFTTTYTYTYAADGRLTLVTASDKSSNSFTYSGNTIIQVNKDSSGGITDSNVYFLNAQSLVDSGVQNHIGIYTYYSYSYNSAGQRSQLKLYNVGNTLLYIYTYGYTNGNITDYHYNDDLGSLIGHTDYTYDNNSVNTLGNDNIGQAYMGHSTTNLILSSNSFSGSTLAQKINFVYTFDNSKRVSNMLAEDSTGTVIYSDAFTYY